MMLENTKLLYKGTAKITLKFLQFKINFTFFFIFKLIDLIFFFFFFFGGGGGELFSNDSWEQ